jgi:hypothetical protein
MGDHDGLESVITIGWNAQSMNATPAKKNYSSFFVIYRYSNRCLARTPQGSLRLLQPEQNAFKR